MISSDPTGIRSVLCLPLCDAGEAFGVLGLYSAEVNRALPEELGLLQELAETLAHGIRTLRTREERAAAQQQVAQQAALLDEATDAIFVRDLEQRITFWSRGAERLYGWSAAEMLGQSALRLHRREPGDAEVFDKAVHAVLEKGQWSGELHKVSKSGKRLLVEARWTLLKGPQGQPLAVLTINTDITAKKQLELQFFRAQRMESIGTLAGGIAHDLNNILAPILLSVSTLRAHLPEEDRLEVLDTLDQCARRGAALVKQVLGFARGVSGKKAPVDPLHLLRDLRGIIRDTFPKNIDFSLESIDRERLVIGDATQLHQVFMNLCVNARDAMPRGGALRIKIDTLLVDELFAGLNPQLHPGRYVVIGVEDTGTGMTPEVRERIFEPFFTTKEVGRGTGLGLSTTLAIIRSHGGIINVYSEPGRGTTFKVFLPAAPDTGLEEEERAASALPTGSGELILVVDDEEAIRTVASKTLERFGYRTLAAKNGAEALDVFARHRDEVALVLTDLAMPVMDGRALIIALKAVAPRLRVIASSGFMDGGSEKAAGQTRVAAFLAKPYTAESLLQTISRVLRGGGEAEEV